MKQTVHKLQHVSTPDRDAIYGNTWANYTRSDQICDQQEIKENFHLARRAYTS